MSLSKELVERFQAVYVNKNGEVLGFFEAEARLRELSELIRLTATDSEEAKDA